MARPAKPTRLKQMQGNPGKRALNKSEPKPDPIDDMSTPRGLKTNAPNAAKFWHEHVEALAKTGIMTGADKGAFLLMSHHYDLALRAVANIHSDGLTRYDENNVERKNPNLQIFRDNSKLFLQYANQFGLTPSARSGLHVSPPAEQLSLADLIFSKVQEAESS